MTTARDSRGRFISWVDARGRRNRDLGTAIESMVAALRAVSPPIRRVRRTLYSTELEFRRLQPWSEVINIFAEADLRNVKKYDRIRYHIAVRSVEGDVRPLSRAYASAELALGQAIEVLQKGTVLSPKDDAPDDGEAYYRSLIVSAFLRKDAMR